MSTKDNVVENDDVFDISTMAAADTAVCEIEKANGDPLLGKGGKQVSITVFGPGSKQYQKATGARNRAVLEHVRKGGKKMKDDDQRRLDAEFLASITASFNNFTYKGMTGYDQYVAAYMDTSIGFIAEQVNKFVSDWGNFTK